MNYKISKPILSVEELKNILPYGKAMPLYMDNEWILCYSNIFGKVFFKAASGQGSFHNNKVFLYEDEVKPEFIVRKREYGLSYPDFKKVWSEDYHCPNCDKHVEPYNYDWHRHFSGKHRVEYCPYCGYPLLWY